MENREKKTVRRSARRVPAQTRTMPASHIRPAPPTFGRSDRKMVALPPAKPTTIEDFKVDYSYVVRDLRWVFTLAAAMFVLLIVLNIIL